MQRTFVRALQAAFVTVLLTPGCRPPVAAAPSHPGAAPMDPSVQQQINAAWKRRKPGYRPRTKHKTQDGQPRYTNRLFLSTSPYLLQHAHNPVNWFVWGDEAFERAAREKKPVLLSVGYSTCHWCHVMEEESFEDEEIARFLNANYIAIKVDREERPDIDAIYMQAVRALTGGGGWPMTVWLTADRKPFFGGTYFPARDGDRGARQGFLTLLRNMRAEFDKDPTKIAEQAESLTARVTRALSSRGAIPNLPGPPVLDAAMLEYVERYDAVQGGLRQRRKFPSSLPIQFLLRTHKRTGDAQALQMATYTLRKMAEGGMYDHVAGGFHRYSTDPEWLVPHFEKMLYDNAQLLMAYIEGFQVTGDPFFRRIAAELIRYINREMAAPTGAFFSATDADSIGPGGEREEGYYFTWTPAELAAVLSPADLTLLTEHYGVTPGGNFEGRNILHVAVPLAEIAKRDQLDPKALRARLDAAREVLYQARQKRPAPLLDDKILTAWNGLTISALAKAGFALADPAVVAQAARAADDVLRRMAHDGRLYRSARGEVAHLEAYVDDYAFLIAGLLDLYEAQADPRWLAEARRLDGVLAQAYADPAGGFFVTHQDATALLAREKSLTDGAIPAGASVQAMNLYRLSALTSEDSYRQRGDGTLKAAGLYLSRAPTAVSELLLALDFVHSQPKEVVLVGADRQATEPFVAVLRRGHFPHRVLVAVAESARAGHLPLVPLLKGKVARGGQATAYVCHHGVCELPTDDVAAFTRLLDKAVPLPPAAP